MITLNSKLWVGLPIAVVAVSVGAAVVGGIEWAFASLGAMVLVGIAGIIIYVSVKALQRSGILFMGGVRKFGIKSDLSLDDNELVGVRPISKEDKRLIMAHIDRFFETGREQSREVVHAEVRPVSEKDKRLIMAHIDKFFETGWEQSREVRAEVRPISGQDKRLIMAHINELFTKGLEQSEGKLF